MILTKRKPYTIGEIIISDFISVDDKDLSNKLIQYLEISQDEFNKFFCAEYVLSKTLSIKLAEFLGTSVDFWINQNKLNLEWYKQNEQTNFDSV